MAFAPRPPSSLPAHSSAHPEKSPQNRRVGIDTGGTFTDVFVVPPSPRKPATVVKVPSTPNDPSLAIAQGLADTGLAGDKGLHIVHGTTVGLNALLTRDLASTALVTNDGFRDLIEIARQDRPDIYALHPFRPAPVVPRELRFCVPQRSWPDPKTGVVKEVLRPTRDDLAALKKSIAQSGAESIAICLLHSWADPAIEERIAKTLRPLGLPITTSASLVPEYREYERFSTATINAALAPIVGDYLERLTNSISARGFGTARLSLMQSNGGTIGVPRAAAQPARVLLSGPAGGVLGAVRAAAEAGLGDIVTLDMGGTSADVAFYSPTGKGGGARSGEAPPIGGLPVALPSLDVHTIGCGGGSLATVDAGGALHVGPASAGAYPGPVAYGNSDALTLTDAHIYMGHILTGAESASIARAAGAGFLGGVLALDIDRVSRAFEALGKQLGVKPRAAAAAMIEIGRAAMGRATGAMTMQRGRDPRSLSLVAFGGAGGLVAAELADSMGIPRVLIPSDPGVLSARGLAQAGFRSDASRSLLAPLDDISSGERTQILNHLADELLELAKQERLAPKDLAIHFTLDLRYAGQSFELGVPAGERSAAKRSARTPSNGALAESFSQLHEHLYGHRMDGHSPELVNLRATAVERKPPVRVRKPTIRPLSADATVGVTTMASGRNQVRAQVLSRASLRPGMGFDGPAIVLEYSGTTMIPPAWRVAITSGGHMLLTRD
jgi:N-methylhydantoinase A